QETWRLEQSAHHFHRADRTASSDQGRLLAIDATQGPLGGLDEGMVDRHDPWITIAAELGKPDPHRLRLNLIDVAAQSLGDGLRILVGDEAAADFGGGPGRDDRLGAGTLIAAPDPVDLQGRPPPVPLPRGERGLTLQRRKAIGLLERTLVEGHAGKLLVITLTQWRL